MKLSKRLEMVVSFAQRGAGARERRGLWRLADVGTDHGYVPIAMALRDPDVQAVAMDVRPGPLKRARDHIQERGLENRIQTRLSDGVENLKAGEADTVVIAGMGGDLVIHILEGGRHLWDTVERWILSPQSELDKVRRYLESSGFVIEDEEMVEEDGKYYTVMEAVPHRQETKGQPGSLEGEIQTEPLGKGRQSGASEEDEGSGQREHRRELLTQARYLYGPRLIEKSSPVLAEFLRREEKVLAGILAELESQDSPKIVTRRDELRTKLSWTRAAMEEMGVSGSKAPHIERH